MKIFQVIQKAQLRGAEIFACQLSEHLKNRGHEVKVICLFEGNASLPFSGEYIYLNRPMNGRLVDFQGWKAFAQLVKEEQPDIIQANAGETLKFCVMSRFFFSWSCPIVFRNASTMSKYFGKGLKRMFYKFLLQQVDGIASVAEFPKMDLMQYFSLSEDKIKVIPVGIEQVDVNPIPILGNPKLIHVGGFSFEKNHQGLIQIFEKILARFPEAHLTLLGDGKLREKTGQLVKEKGLENHISFLGNVKNPMDFMASAEVMLFPSILEGLPGVILEAQYIGLPVIAYNVGGIGEIIEHEKTGLLVEKGEEEKMLECSETLQANPQLKRAIIQRAKKQVKTHFKNEYLASVFEKLYQEISQC